MTGQPSYLGFPIKTASNEELRDGIMHGNFVHREAGMAFYERDGKIFVVEADKPISIKR